MVHKEEPVVFVNGDLVPESKAVVSVFDRGFRWGDGVYEMSRTFGGRVFKLKEHLERLRWSLNYTRIDPGLSMEELERVTLELVDRNLGTGGPEVEDVGVTHIISRGPMDPTRKATSKPTVVIYTETLAFGMYARWYAQGVKMITPATRRTPPQSLSPKAKISNKMNHFVAQFEAQAIDPDALPLMLDYDGNVAESSGANFFFLAQGCIHVPNRRHVLGGISMDTVLEVAQEMGIEVREGDYTPFDVYKAEEAFLTSTPWSMAPVVSLNGLKIGQGVPGPVFHQLIQAWSERVGIDIVDQAMAHLQPQERKELVASTSSTPSL